MGENEAMAISTLTNAPSSNGRRWSRRAERHLLGPLMAVPTLLTLSLTIVFPMLYSLILSAYSWKLTEINKPKTFVFLENYREILSDEIFWTATRNTFAFVIGTVSVELILGFLIALLLTEITRGRKLANSIILLPMIITIIVVSVMPPAIHVLRDYLKERKARQELAIETDLEQS